MASTVLLTGSTGYIGSHVAVELLNAGYEVIGIDNLSNSCEKSLQAVSAITGKSVDFYQADVRDEVALRTIFNKHKIDVCIHCAGLKAVGESVTKPLEYYDNNIGGSLNLFFLKRSHG